MQCSELARWLGLLFAQYVSFYLFLEKKMWINGSNTFSTFFSVHQQLRHLGTAICFNVTSFAQYVSLFLFLEQKNVDLKW